MNNKVELIEISGSDVEIACAAWYSSQKKITPDRLERVPQRIKDMACPSDGSPPHTVPFEHNRISWSITSDYPTHIQFLKHRMFSISSQSARYMEFKEDLSYVPDDWPEINKMELQVYYDNLFYCYHKMIESLINSGMQRSRAKETARYMLPTGTQIKYYLTTDLLNFIKFLKLRLDGHAQLEIRVLAQQMLEQLQQAGNFNLSLDAWGVEK